MTSENKREENGSLEVQKIYTREEVQEALSSIAQQVVGSQTAYLHSMVLLNQLLRLPNAVELFDADLKSQARDLWVKIKSSGLQLADPPLLAGENVQGPVE